MKTLLELVERIVEEGDAEKLDPTIGDRGMINIDVEILLNVHDRIIAPYLRDQYTNDFNELDDRALAMWTNWQRTLNR